MHDNLVPVLIVLIVVGLPIMGGVLIKLAKIVKGDSSDKPRGSSSAEDAEIMQDMHRTLTRLEQRIEALETIFDNQRNS